MVSGVRNCSLLIIATTVVSGCAAPLSQQLMGDFRPQSLTLMSTSLRSNLALIRNMKHLGEWHSRVTR